MHGKKIRIFNFSAGFKSAIYHVPISFHQKSKQTLREMAASNEDIQETALTSQFQTGVSEKLLRNLFLQKQMQ